MMGTLLDSLFTSTTPAVRRPPAVPPGPRRGSPGGLGAQQPGFGSDEGSNFGNLVEPTEANIANLMVVLEPDVYLFICLY